MTLVQLAAAIALWCSVPNSSVTTAFVNKCRAQLIKCIDANKSFPQTNDKKAWECFVSTEIKYF